MSNCLPPAVPAELTELVALVDKTGWTAHRLIFSLPLWQHEELHLIYQTKVWTLVWLRNGTPFFAGGAATTANKALQNFLEECPYKKCQ